MDPKIVEAWRDGDCDAAAQARNWLWDRFYENELSTIEAIAESYPWVLPERVADWGFDRSIETLDVMLSGGRCHCINMSAPGSGPFLGRFTQGQFDTETRLPSDANVPGAFYDLFKKRWRDALRAAQKEPPDDADLRKALRGWAKGRARPCARAIQLLWQARYGHGLSVVNARVSDGLSDQSPDAHALVSAAFVTSMEALDVRLAGGRFFTVPIAGPDQTRAGRFTETRVPALAAIRPDGLTADTFWRDYFRPALLEMLRRRKVSDWGPSAVIGLGLFLDANTGNVADGLRLLPRASEWARLAVQADEHPQVRQISLWSLVLFVLKTAEHSPDPTVAALVPRNLDDGPIAPELIHEQTMAWLGVYSRTWGMGGYLRALSPDSLDEIAEAVQVARWDVVMQLLDGPRRGGRKASKTHADGVKTFLDRQLDRQLAQRADTLLATIRDHAGRADLAEFAITQEEWRSFLMTRLEFSTRDALDKALHRVRQALERLRSGFGDEGAPV